MRYRESCPIRGIVFSVTNIIQAKRVYICKYVDM